MINPNPSLTTLKKESFKYVAKYQTIRNKD